MVGRPPCHSPDPNSEKLKNSVVKNLDYYDNYTSKLFMRLVMRVNVRDISVFVSSAPCLHKFL